MKNVGFQSKAPKKIVCRQQQSHKISLPILFLILLFRFAYHRLRYKIEKTMFLFRLTFAHLFLFIHHRYVYERYYTYISFKNNIEQWRFGEKQPVFHIAMPFWKNSNKASRWFEKNRRKMSIYRRSQHDARRKLLPGQYQCLEKMFFWPLPLWQTKIRREFSFYLNWKVFNYRSTKTSKPGMDVYEIYKY